MAPSGIPTAFPDDVGPVELAGHLDRAMAVLRDANATASAVRAAGEFQQHAIRVLANADRAFRRAVVARLSPEAAFVTRSCVRAARTLDAMGGPATTAAPLAHRRAAVTRPLYAHYRQGTGAHGRPVDIPRRDQPRRDPDGPHPRQEHRRGARTHAVHPGDLGAVRRRR